MEKTQTITVDNVNYDLSTLSDGIKQAVGFYNAINLDLGKAQLEVIKSQAALANIGAQIAEAVKKEQAEATAVLDTAAE